MQIRILHRTHYRYAESARGIIQILRLMPRGHAGQHVLDWRVEVDV
ncbi:MAG: transglutaminase N-terminal domain-containing protein, partial [Beijerinckiaceae bacterium]